MTVKIAQSWATWPLRGKWYRTQKVYVCRINSDLTEDVVREIELTVSPTGRSVQVYVDGQKWGPQ